MRSCPLTELAGTESRTRGRPILTRHIYPLGMRRNTDAANWSLWKDEDEVFNAVQASSWGSLPEGRTYSVQLLGTRPHAKTPVKTQVLPRLEFGCGHLHSVSRISMLRRCTGVNVR